MLKSSQINSILVVDDDINTCAMIERYLQAVGYACSSITNPVEALSILKQGDFHLVISDIEMAEINGLELISKISAAGIKVHTIIMTGFTADYIYSDVIKAGASDFIQKPFQMSELKAKIERLNRERALLKDLQDLNTALGVLLQMGEKEREDFRGEVTSNLRELVFPCLEKLKNSHLNAVQRRHLEILESTLLDICSPFSKNLSDQHAHISSREVQVANLIKAGKENKEIAEILGVSVNTVLTHRHRLRSKLGLKGDKTSLKSYLNSIEF
jgi:FixJ family two-component response regulator